AIQLSAANVYSINTEAFVATLQELFGWSVLFGVIVLIAIAASRFKIGVKKPIPSLRGMYKAIFAFPILKKA
ncbi:MAG: hypothetical protein LBH32_07075, partial [Dysgonamonadaceae bacterium]|nr:hypothetical protein [Dysgonamonadaceae bacterium]